MLTLVDEEPTHGFAIATLTAEDGDVGRAWHVPRPIVYRSLDRLTQLGLVRTVSTEAGQRGPRRSVIGSTPAGRVAVTGWLARPVTHVRDVRSELLVKLGLLLRRGISATRLIAAQRGLFAPLRQALEKRLAAENDFGAILTRWRLENVDAALRFLDAPVPGPHRVGPSPD